MCSVLSAKEIRSLIAGCPPLIEGYVDLDEQVQPNGFDISLQSIAALESKGVIAASNRDRKLPGLKLLEFGADGFIDLLPGAYLITFNEIVHLPNDLMALARPRSSLGRCGVTVHTAVWDAGYNGRSQSLLQVINPHGFRLQKNARVVQLVFFRLSSETEGYSGIYQGENIK
jgi:dUTP pyrophosphatase